jgi:hypothetical protein
MERYAAAAGYDPSEKVASGISSPDTIKGIRSAFPRGSVGARPALKGQAGQKRIAGSVLAAAEMDAMDSTMRHATDWRPPTEEA